MEEDNNVNLVNINIDETETKMQLVGTDTNGQHYIVVTGQESGEWTQTVNTTSYMSWIRRLV